MKLKSEPTPLATKWFGCFYDGSKANVDHYKMILRNHFVVKTGCNEKSWFATKWVIAFTRGNAMGEQKRSERTISISIDWFWNQICPIFPSSRSLHKKHAFRTFRGLSGGGRNRFYKRLCTHMSLQNAVHDTNHPETRTSRIESVLCDIVGERNSEHGFVELGWNLTIG